MSRDAEKRIKDIREKEIGGTNKKVLVVEGTDDVDAFRLLLDRQNPERETRWALAHAGNRKRAIDIAAKERDWLILIDRDEHPAEGLADPNVMMLPRFCLESYLSDPAELWEALPQKQRDNMAGGAAQLHAALLENLPVWRRHAALWHVINPRWAGLRARGFNRDVLNPQCVPDDVLLKQTLNDWSTYLDADTLFNEIQQRLIEMNAQPLDDFLHRSLHAKKFFSQVVVPTLDRFLGQASEAERRRQLFAHLPLPADLAPLWQRLDDHEHC